MNFDTVQATVNDLLSVRRKYIIPRNQREFSWEKLQLDEFWDDVTRNINYNSETETFEYSEYFLGTIVLSGQESSGVLDIIDGQQRLTVITICLSLISRVLREIGFEQAADTILSTYIITPSTSLLKTDPTEKIEKTNGKLYFKLRFQSKADHSGAIEYDEDEKLKYAGDYIQRKINKNQICLLLNKSKQGVKYTNDEYAACLDAVVTMITRYVKMVRISVGSEDDAYDIFEVLNARGISLSSIDLIKNAIFKNCTTTYPIDFAKKQWTEIDEILKERDSKSSLSEYIRAWWLSKFNYVGTDQLYRSFKKAINNQTIEFTPQIFLDSLRKDVELYAKIISPRLSDWKQADQREIYNTLNALNIFDVTIARPLLLSALRLRAEKPRALPQSDMINLFKKIEQFHFRFNAICKSKPSGIDSAYSTQAVTLSKSTTKREALESISKTVEFINSKIPAQSIFIEKFENELWYTNDRNISKKLISYIFQKIELAKRKTNELSHELVSIEHIGSQSTYDQSVVGKIGNLLPLGFALNEECRNKPVTEKVKIYETSDLIVVKDFTSNFSGEWTPDDVNRRSNDLATLAYDLI